MFILIVLSCVLIISLVSNLFLYRIIKEMEETILQLEEQY